MKFKAQMAEMLLHNDTRTAEACVGLLATLVGFAYVVDGPPIGTPRQLQMSGWTLLVFGVTQWASAVLDVLATRHWSNCLGFLSAAVNLWRGWHAQSLVTTAFFGGFMALCWFFWWRTYLAHRSKAEQESAACKTGIET